MAKKTVQAYRQEVAAQLDLLYGKLFPLLSLPRVYIKDTKGEIVLDPASKKPQFSLRSKIISVGELRELNKQDPKDFFGVIANIKKIKKELRKHYATDIKRNGTPAHTLNENLSNLLNALRNPYNSRSPDSSGLMAAAERALNQLNKKMHWRGRDLKWSPDIEWRKDQHRLFTVPWFVASFLQLGMLILAPLLIAAFTPYRNQALAFYKDTAISLAQKAAHFFTKSYKHKVGCISVGALFAAKEWYYERSAEITPQEAKPAVVLYGRMHNLNKNVFTFDKNIQQGFEVLAEKLVYQAYRTQFVKQSP